MGAFTPLYMFLAIIPLVPFSLAHDNGHLQSRSCVLDELQSSLEALLVPLLGDLKGEAAPVLECSQCTGILTAMKAIAECGDSSFVSTFGGLCSMSGLLDSDVCVGLASQQGPAIAQVLRDIDPVGYAGQTLCHAIIGTCNPSLKNSTTSIPPPPASLPAPIGSESNQPLTVLHISDWHYDPGYIPGTEAQCTKPLCCRGFNSSSPGVAALPAPSWGAYNCDAPLKLGESMLQSIVPLLGKQPDFVIFTGDVPPHDVWETSPEGVNNATSTSYALFRTYINAPVYPTVGNHETSPVNLYQPAAIQNPPNNQWVFDNLTSNDWNSWLDATALSYADAHRGAYAVNVQKGLRLVSLNSNDCYADNFWLFADTDEVDPNSQLSWLISQLSDAETTGQKVWIISHIPASVDCLENWSNFHNTIVNRFSATIAGIFSGHTHRDQFELYYDGKGKAVENAVQVGFIGPSVTPYTNLNPGWRAYTVDPQTFEVVDAVTYITDLSLAAELDKSGGSPTWFKEYSMRDLLPSWPSSAPLNATFFAQLVQTFQNDDSVFQQYYKYRSKLGPEADGGCSGECKSDVIQDLMAGDSTDATFSFPLRRQEPQRQAWKPWNKDLCRLHSSPHH